MLEGDNAAGSPTSLPGGFLAPMGSPSFMSALQAISNSPLGSTQQAPTALPQVTFSQILQALAGPPPSPVSAVNPGPAPTLGDYWNPAPYQQAASSVRQGETSGVGTVNQAYQQALNQTIAQGKQAAAQAGQYVNQAQQSAKQAGSQEQANINTALQGQSAGSLLGNQLAGTQAVLQANNQRGVGVAQDLQNLVGANTTGFEQDLNASKANALQYLNSQVQGELNKIGLTQASDQTKAQQMYQQALKAYQTNNQNAIDAAASTNAKDATAYSTQAQNALKEMMTVENSLALSPRASLQNTLAGPNLLEPQVTNAFQSVLYGSPTAAPGSLMYGSADSQPVKQQQRIQALQRLDPGIASAVSDMLSQWNNTTKQAASPQALENYLASLTGGQ